MKWKIYKITNSETSKCYIGITIRSLNKRFQEHRNSKTSVIGNAIRKYGTENFIIEIIDYADNLQDALYKESYYIGYYNSCTFSNGYNLIKNSVSGEFTDDILARHSDSLRRQKAENPDNPFLGVYFLTEPRKWCFSFRIKNKSKRMKNFKTPRDAALTRDYHIAKIWEKDFAIKLMNFPELYDDMVNDVFVLPERIIKNNKKTSKYKGVHYEKRFNKWRVRINYKKLKNKNIRYTNGLFETEKDAAELSDYINVVGYEKYEDLNFPENLNLYKSEYYRIPFTTIEKKKKTKYKNISIDDKYYRIFIEKDKRKFRETFKNIDDAVKRRNEILISIGRKIPND